MRINNIEDLIRVLKSYSLKDASLSQIIELQFLENKYNFKEIENMINNYLTDYKKGADSAIWEYEILEIARPFINEVEKIFKPNNDKATIQPEEESRV